MTKPPDNEMLLVLEARERRWKRRIQMATEEAQTVVTITLCLPLACRTHPDYTSVFPHLCALVTSHLVQGGATAAQPVYTDGADGPACLLPVSGSADGVKRLCVEVEERFAAGRMLDVDVMDSHGTPIGRSELGLPPRRCFICEQPAAVCVAGRVHPPQEIIRHAEELLHLCQTMK